MHIFNVVDLTNFSVSMLAGKVKAMAQKAAAIAQDYYPEQLAVLMIVNAPMLFTGVWAVVKLWLDEKTRQKIQIHGSGFKAKMLEYVDEDQLADFLGGSNTHKLDEDWGPWKDFEVVDGAKKGDVVGIRPKGTDGDPIFTP